MSNNVLARHDAKVAQAAEQRRAAEELRASLIGSTLEEAKLALSKSFVAVEAPFKAKTVEQRMLEIENEASKALRAGLAEAFAAADVDKDGYIRFKEYVKFMQYESEKAIEKAKSQGQGDMEEEFSNWREEL